MDDMGRGDHLALRRQRLRRLAVATCTVAAILLALSAAAVASAAASSDPPSTLVLQQSLNGHVECVSPDATCIQVNLYGQNGDPNLTFIDPGEQHVATVDLTNAGTLAATSLTVTAGDCTSRLCDTVEVSILCTTGGAETFSLGPMTLNQFGDSGTHVVSNGLAPGNSSTCTFTTEYPLHAPLILGARSVQPVTWTLTAAEVPPPTTTIPPATTTPAPPTTKVNGPPPTAPPTSKVNGPSVVAPPVAGPPSPPGALAMTGTDALALAIAGMALLAIGGLLLWMSRRRGASQQGDSPTVAT